MKTAKILGVFMAILMISCSSDHKESDVKASESIVYKISELPLYPDFAKPVNMAGEERQFTLIKNDGTAINFNLKSVEEKLFGKNRTLIGTVAVGKNEPEDAVMIVGENGFELYFRNRGEDLVLKGKKELDAGFKQLDLNFDAESKKEFMAAAKKLGHDGEALLRGYGVQQTGKKVATGNFNVIIEKSKNYDLIDESASRAKKESIQGKSMDQCLSMLPPLAANDNLQQNTAENKNNNLSKNSKIIYQNKDGRKTYNMDFVYMDPNFPYGSMYTGVIFSFLDLTKKLGLKKENYNIVPNLSLYSPADTPAAKAEYLAAFSRVPDALEQLKKVVNYVKTHPSELGTKVVRCAMYDNYSWNNNQTLGMAYGETYGRGFSDEYSSLIANNLQNNVLAHEVGHNLGALHVSNGNDIMYNEASGKLIHLDAENLRKIKNCITTKW